MNILLFFLSKCVRTAAKTMVVDRKNQKVLALLYLTSWPLQNAANLSIVPTEFAAEPTTKMKSSMANLVTWTFHLPPKRQLSILLNVLFPFIDGSYFFSSSVELNRFAKQAKLLKNLFFKSDGGHAISRQEKRILHPPSGCLGTPLSLP